MNETKTTQKNVVEYLHKCKKIVCGCAWWSDLKVSHCPDCGHIHIWFRDTSRLKEEDKNGN